MDAYLGWLMTARKHPLGQRLLVAVMAVFALLQPALSHAQGAARQPQTAGIGYIPGAAATDPRRLDLYLPAPDSRAHPLVIFTRGSAWLANNGREEAQVLAAALNPLGYAVAGVAVRTSGQARFPAQVFDIKAAIRWSRANAAAYSIDPARIAVMGDSSGGWVAAMAALTGGYAPMEGRVGNLKQSSRVQAAVAFYPPVDFSTMDAWALEPCRADVKSMFARRFCRASADSPESRLIGCPVTACPDKVQLANPIRYIRSDAPPMLIVHGDADTVVPRAQGEMLFNALARACRTATFVSLPIAGHGNWAAMLTDPKIGYGATIRSTAPECGVAGPMPVTMGWPVLVEFLNAHLKR